MDSPDKKIITSAEGFKLFQNPPSQQELERFYAKTYYQDPQGTYQASYSKEEQQQRSKRIQLMGEFIDINLHGHDLGQKSFLDVGCGEGFALDHFRKIGWKVKGLDFSTHGAQMNNPTLVEYVESGDIFESLEQLAANGEVFDVIFLGNVLEHVLNPIELLKLIYSVLKGGGLFCVTVPNDFSMLQQSLLERHDIESEYWLVYPDHLNYFNLKNLTNLLKDLQLPVVDSYCDFPIEWFLANKNSNYAKDPSKGKDSHNARVFLDSMINGSPNQAAKMNFWRSLSELGFGRTITIISKKL
jgi:SAM-dependent methyltransferase